MWGVEALFRAHSAFFEMLNSLGKRWFPEEGLPAGKKTKGSAFFGPAYALVLGRQPPIVPNARGRSAFTQVPDGGFLS